jgi:NAD(P)-dependent dehydrogenase (short-subunit alcohol dehydrogenase family)
MDDGTSSSKAAVTNMNTNIEGKAVVIAGASSGLGEATARHLSPSEHASSSVHGASIDNVRCSLGVGQGERSPIAVHPPERRMR